MVYLTGLDVGSTTVKVIVLDENLDTVYSEYTRHFSNVRETVVEILERVYKKFPNNSTKIAVTGSGAMGIYELLDVEFVQEVVAGTEAIRTLIPETDVAIELGGEDSKITYMNTPLEQRMNSICAGGTGAFIDQMASLMETDAAGLNKAAKKYKNIYPIASRCGVFAKTDIQALMNQGASIEDLSVSVFQSVVNQTISNLAQGRPIDGKVALLGGPLHFLPELRKRFIETLKIKDEDVIIPKDPQLFVAIGAALLSKETEEISFEDLYNRLKNTDKNTKSVIKYMDPLFENQKELDEFHKRHRQRAVEIKTLEGYKGPLYLGVDAGSTTSKMVLIDNDGNIRHEYYNNNKGKPLDVIVSELKNIYQLLDKDAYIANSGITGYGEDFIQAALGIDMGQVETIAHLRAAQYFEPEVDYIVDIGGQDMKTMEIKDGVINDIHLNEACSSGCGSFLETFAQSINLTVEEFSKLSLLAKNPVDLGSRCTVFMNSMVRQAQKEGASVGDISAGLSYSVILNAIQKVMDIKDMDSLGDHIVVQGGTFYSDGILRAFEKITGKEVIRPNIAGLMGAFGMALIAREENVNEHTTLIDQSHLDDFNYTTKDAVCRQCTNNCKLKINLFSGGNRYITGNRCERGAGVERNTGSDLPNLYRYKYNRVFDYDSLELKDAPRGEIGILRILNMYENYPFWHTFLTSLGFSVVLSEESTRETYERGIESIVSETACYPAKISHGHLEGLLEKGVKKIFHPSVFYEEREYQKADNSINCPVVTGYSEVLKHNVVSLKEYGAEFINPFISLDNRRRLVDRLNEVFPNITRKEIETAVHKAYAEQQRYREDVIAEGKRALGYIKTQGKQGIALAGRPYHIDPEINHGLPELIESMDLVVLSEDAIAFYDDVSATLRVLDQWTYHGRLYRAAEFVGMHENLEMIQLNSFGCGIDAVTTDQVEEILSSYGKLYTVIKIDEISNLGAVRIRLRSLLEASKRRQPVSTPRQIEDKDPLMFTKEMADEGYTILMPQMAPIHFALMEPVLRSENINVEVLEDTSETIVSQGLRYVHNDACYPAMFVVGQFMDAIKSGKYNTDKLALIMSQTGGACRASNYVGFIRKALEDAGYGHIPVIGLSFQGIENHEGLFKDARMISLGKKLLLSILYGDLLQRLSLATRVYEQNPGQTDEVLDHWTEKLAKNVQTQGKRDFKLTVDRIIKDFENISVTDEIKPKVGIVGEILVKYLPGANNYITDLLEEEGAEPVLGDMMDFLFYSMKNADIKYKKLSKGWFQGLLANIFIKYVEGYRSIIRKALENTRFTPPSTIEELMEYAQEFVSLGNQYGEGWLLTAEMVELIHNGATNIVCVQPFGCLPNHITGKGVMKAIREKYKYANIIAIDYDASASKTNQQNRIKLMLTRGEEDKEKARLYSEELKRNRA